MLAPDAEDVTTTNLGQVNYTDTGNSDEYF